MTTILIVYVDDIIVTCNELLDIKSIKYQLSKPFEMKKFEKLRYLLGMQIVTNKDSMCIF